MSFVYGGITYHTDETNPDPLRDLITGVGLPGSGTPSYYAPLSAEDLAHYILPGEESTSGGGEGGGSPGSSTVNWQAMPDTMFGPAYAINPVESGVNLYNPRIVTNDPNYGEITPTANVNNRQLSDFAGPLIMAILSAAMPAAIGAVGGAGAGLGAGQGLFNAAGNFIEGNKLNPLSLVGPVANAAGFSLPDIGSSGYTPPTGGNMDFGFGDFQIPDFGGSESDWGNYFGTGFGTGDSGGYNFEQPTTDWGYGGFGTSDTGGYNFTDPNSSGGYNFNMGGDGSTGGIPTGGSMGGFSLPFGMTGGQLATLLGGLGLAGYGMYTGNQAANAVTGAANTQAQSNLDLANLQSRLNNPNMITPYGTSTYTIGPDGRPILTQSLSPAEQAKLTGTEQLQQGALGMAGNVLGNASGTLGRSFGGPNPMLGFDPRYAIGGVQLDPNFSGAPPNPTASEADRQQAQQAAYQNVTQYLDPQWAQKQSDLTTQLSNQGITPGSPAYDRAMLNFNNAKQQAYESARQQAVQQGLEAEKAQYGMQLSSRQQAIQEIMNALQAHNVGVGEQAGIAGQSTNLYNQGQGQSFGQYTTGQTLPISQLAQLMGLSPILNPTFQGTQATTIPQAPYYQAGIAGANINQGTTQNLFNLLGRLGGGYLNQPTTPTGVA